MAEVPLPTPTNNTVPSADIRDAVYAGAMLDKVVTGSELKYTDRLGGEHYTVDGMKAEGDKVVEDTRLNLIPLGKQYMSLDQAQADIANIPEGAATYVRSPDDSDGKTLAVEYKNIGGSLVATGRRFSSQEYVDSVNEYVITRLYEETLPGIPVAFIDDNGSVFLYGTDAGETHVPGLSLQYCVDIAYKTKIIPGVSHVELDENGFVLRWIDDTGVTHYPAGDGNNNPEPVVASTAVISPQVYDNALITELGYNQWINNVAVKFGRDYLFSSVRLGTTSPSRIFGALAISRRQGREDALAFMSLLGKRVFLAQLLLLMITMRRVSFSIPEVMRKSQLPFSRLTTLDPSRGCASGRHQLWTPRTSQTQLPSLIPQT